MRRIRYYVFKAGPKLSFEDLPAIVHRFLDEQGLKKNSMDENPGVVPRTVCYRHVYGKRGLSGKTVVPFCSVNRDLPGIFIT